MTGNELVREKVKGYLSGLSSAARQMLLKQLEVSASGSTLDDVRTILEAAREVEAEANRPQTAARPTKPAASAPRPDLKTLFFEPFRQHLIDEVLPVHQKGWISRPSLDGIWTYLVREVLPDTLAPMLEPDHGFHGASDEEREAQVRDLRVDAFARLDRIVEAARGEQVLLQKLQSRIGGRAAYEDLLEILVLRDRTVALDRLYAKLPGNASMGEASEGVMRDAVLAHVSANPRDAALIAAGIASRLSSPAILVRFAAALAQSDDPQEIRKLPAAAFIDVALSVLERKVMRLIEAIASPGRIPAAVDQIKRFHDGLRASAAAVQIEADGEWRQRLGKIRREMSDVVGRQVEAAVPTIRRAFHLSPNARPSPEDAAEAEKAVAIFAMARRCRDSLALNESLNRIGPTVEQAAELYGRELFDRIRKAKGEELPEFVAVSDHMLRVAELLQGDDYAQSLRRSRDKAVKDASS